MSALHQTAIYGIGIMLGRMAPLITLPLITGYLTPGDYGRLELLALIAEFGSLLAGAGLSVSVFRWATIGGDETRRQAGAEVLALASLLTVLIGAVAWLWLPAIASLMPASASRLELQLVALSFALTACIEAPLALVRIGGRAVVFVVLSLARVALQILLIWLFLRAGYGVAGVLAANMLAALALAIALMLDLVPRFGWRLPCRASVRRHALYGLPLMLAGLANFVQNAGDRWLVGDQLGATDLALYALAIKAFVFTAFAVKPYEMWWEANRQRMLETERGLERIAAYAGLGVALALVAAAGMALLGPYLLRLATPEAYHDAALWLPIAAALGGLHAANGFIGTGIYFRETGFANLWINVFTAVVALGLYALLIPSYGFAGALAGRAVSQLVRAIAFAVVGARSLPLALPWTRLAVAGGLALTLVMTSMSMDPSHGPWLAMAAFSLIMFAPLALGLVPGRSLVSAGWSR